MMTANKTITIIILAVLVAIIAMAAFMLTQNEKDEPITPAGEDTYCWIYGNANMDNYVNEEDIDYIRAIIAGDLKPTKYSDANMDGVTDEKDIDVVKGYINSTGDKRYYTMDNGEPGFIKGKIKTLGAQYYANMYALAAIGATGMVTCADDETAKLANRGDFGKVVQSQNLKNYGYTGTYEPETILSMPCDAIVCGTNYFKDWEKQYWTDDVYKPFIRLACWKTAEPMGPILTVATLLQDKTIIENAIEYVEYCQNIIKMADNAVSKLDKKKSTVIIYPYKDGRMEFQGPTTGCYEASLMAGLDNLAARVCNPEVDKDEGFHILDLETALKYQPDTYIILAGCGWNRTQDDVNSAYTKYVDAFLANQTAVKEGKVWFSSWRFTQGAFQPVGALMMISEIYGVDNMDTMKEFQKYVDRFTSQNLGVSPNDPDYLDVTKTGMYFNKATNVS